MDLHAKKVVVMGLGLNGGGVASARFACQQGALVTVTDLRPQQVLQPSIDQLAGLPIRYVLGEHNPQDFSSADVVIKNPAIANNSPLLRLAPQVETDLSLFLRLRPQQPIYAVTGTKGKSTVASLLARILAQVWPDLQCGGNLGTSPLSFLDQLSAHTPVVLELSSWQLHDLGALQLLRPKVAVITNIMPDHLNRYASFADYAQDKLLIYQQMSQDGWMILPQITVEEGWSRSWASSCQQWQQQVPSQVLWASPTSTSQRPATWCSPDRQGWLAGQQGPQRLFSHANLPGQVGAYNSLLAAAAAYCAGVDTAIIAEQVQSFPGLAHRLQKVASHEGVDYYNDSAATVPEATAAALEAFQGRSIHLIVGGTDKQLDFGPLLAPLLNASAQLYLLEGSATQAKLLPLLQQQQIPYQGPFNSMATALAAIHTQPGELVLLSPGCTSFEMFLNEFDRGRQFCQLVERKIEDAAQGHGAPSSGKLAKSP